MRLLTVVLLSFITLSLHAANITLVNDQSSSSDNWNTAADWSNGLAPSSDNAYSTGSLTLRAGSFFDGGSLTIDGGTLLVPSSAATTYLTLASGTVETTSANAFVIGSFLSLSGANSFLAANGATLNLSATIISGSGSISFGDASGKNNGTYTIATNTTQDFSGTINILSGNFAIQSGASYLTTDFVFSSDVQAVTGGTTVGGLTVNGVSFDPGTYTASQLNTLADTTMFKSGTYTVVETPEPASIALLSFSLGGFLFLRRRLRPV
jgi:hypothetical protein